tara:strand:- start:352 stop:561 length:210 start_codon:yes stop_codon:yes gene_type:complete
MMRNNEILKHLKEYSKTLKDIPIDLKTEVDEKIEKEVNSIIYKLENYLDLISDNEYYTIYSEEDRRKQI